MTGIVLAVIYGCLLWLVGAAWERIFQKVTTFLYRWYIATTFLGALLAFLAVTGMASVIGNSISEGAGLWIGSLIGGGIGFLFVAIWFAFSLISIVGALLLRTSLREPQSGVFVWDKRRLTVGCVLIGISVLAGLSRKS